VLFPHVGEGISSAGKKLHHMRENLPHVRENLPEFREKLPNVREKLPEFRENLPHAVFEKKRAGFRPPLTTQGAPPPVGRDPRWKAEGLPDPPLTAKPLAIDTSYRLCYTPLNRRCR
jgi:hypothetical protein